MRAFGLAGSLLPGEWYVVALPLDSSDLLNRPVMNPNRQKDIKIWLNKQIKDGIIEFWDTDNFGRYAFMREEDAMLFKLRWL